MIMYVRFEERTMTYRGRIKNGVAVLEGNPHLPEGTAVRIEVVEPELTTAEPRSLESLLAPVVGKGVGLPADGATNHDHYIYGKPQE